MSNKSNLKENTFTIQGEGFVADVIRTNRKKTIAYNIKDGKVSILVPKTLSAKEIPLLIAKKQRWITEKLQRQKTSLEIKPKAYVAGTLFSYLGHEVKLTIKAGRYPTIQHDQQKFIVSVRDPAINNAPAIKQMLIKWYQQQAEIILQEKTRRFAQIIGVNPSKISIKTYKARWGSCSIRAEIQYNWKIIMAPEKIIKYLVVHELCHILHHNHSPSFWQEVARYHPDYKISRSWLKVNGKNLDL